jgi:hypothetical protein
MCVDRLFNLQYEATAAVAERNSGLVLGADVSGVWVVDEKLTTDSLVAAVQESLALTTEQRQASTFVGSRRKHMQYWFGDDTDYTDIGSWMVLLRLCNMMAPKAG